MTKAKSPKIRFPAMADGQTHWAILGADKPQPPFGVMGPHYQLPVRKKWHVRIAKSALMKLHDSAERVWHWAWRQLRKFEPKRPDSIDGPISVRITRVKINRA